MLNITEQEVEHVADLTRIKLSETEKQKLTHDLGAILTYVTKLNEVSTDAVEPTAQVTGLEDVMRVDEVDSVSATTPDIKEHEDLLIGQAPAREGRLVKVKAILNKVKS